MLVLGSILPHYVIYLTVFFNLFFHTYIVFLVGIFNSIHTFISWNCMCMCITSFVFSYPTKITKIDSIFFENLTIFHFLVFVSLFYFPLAQLFGLNDFVTLAHAYFVPNATGGPTFLILSDSYLHKIPSHDNGFRVKIHKKNSNICYYISTRPSVTSSLLKQIGCDSKDNMLVFEGDWVNNTLMLGKYDNCNEKFGSGFF